MDVIVDGDWKIILIFCCVCASVCVRVLVCMCVCPCVFLMSLGLGEDYEMGTRNIMEKVNMKKQ